MADMVCSFKTFADGIQKAPVGISSLGTAYQRRGSFSLHGVRNGKDGTKIKKKASLKKTPF